MANRPTNRPVFICVPKPTSLLRSDREGTNANGGTKWRQISRT